MSDACLWRRVNEQDDDRDYETECGQMHSFMEGGPMENKHTFCPYCGRGLVLAATSGEGEKLALLYKVVATAAKACSGIQTIETEHEQALLADLDDALSELAQWQEHADGH